MKEYYENEKFEKLSLSEEVIRNVEFADCVFDSCDFADCRIFGCHFSECVFRDCTVAGLQSEMSALRFAQFENCSIVGVDWTPLRPSGKFGEPVRDFENCRLKYNTFTDMSFRKFPFAGNALVGCLFGDSNLMEADFRGCDLKETEFLRCDLRKADFRDASDYRIDILSCKMKGARFSYGEALNLLAVLDIKIE